MNEALFEADILRDEGQRSTVYFDSLGVPTIGRGHNGNKPLSARAIQMIYEDDKADAVADLNRLLPWWKAMTDARQRAIANMCYQLGYPRLSKFTNMLKAMQSGDYDTAAAEALDSTWATQTPDRAKRIAQMIREG